ncbi:MAG: SDR family oxidoreductase [Pseudomonadales bacterium]|nr:SDR family oxidoreductase [Pseudomonadales bacterium]
MTFSIKGNIALVTGSNRGIGREITETFLREKITDKVYVAVRDLKSVTDLVTRYGDKVVPLHIDLCCPDSIITAAKIANDVNIVVNNAGVFEKMSSLHDDAIDSLRDQFEVNTFGLMRIAKAFSPVLKNNGGGVFIQINSICSIKTFWEFSTYSASKAAAYSLTQSLREDFSQQGTFVLSVHPGPIYTDMSIEAGFEHIAEPARLVSEGIINAVKNGEFHLFPGTRTEDISKPYMEYATKVIPSKKIVNV